MRAPWIGSAVVLLVASSPAWAGKGEKPRSAAVHPSAPRAARAPKPPGPVKRAPSTKVAHMEPQVGHGKLGQATYHAQGQSSWGRHRWYPNHSHRSYATHSNRPNGWEQARLKHLNALKADLDRVGVGTVIGSNHTTPLHRDLHAVVQGGAAARPADGPVKQLSNDLASGLSRRHSATLNTHQLTLDLEEVMNHAHISVSEVNHAIGRAKATLSGSGIAREEVQAIDRDLHAIASGLGSVPTQTARAGN